MTIKRDNVNKNIVFLLKDGLNIIPALLYLCER